MKTIESGGSEHSSKDRRKKSGGENKGKRERGLRKKEAGNWKKWYEFISGNYWNNLLGHKYFLYISIMRREIKKT